MRKNLEEADRVEGLRLKTRKISLDLSMRPVSVAFEDQGQWALETGVSQVPGECPDGQEMERVSVSYDWTVNI